MKQMPGFLRTDGPYQFRDLEKGESGMNYEGRLDAGMRKRIARIFLTERSMKWVEALFFMFLSVMFLHGPVHAAGDFGIELGADIERYRHVRRDEHTVELFKMYEVQPETPHPDFDTYAVDTYDGKIIRIMASSPDDHTRTGETTLKVYKKICGELTKKYGDPGFVLNEIEEYGEDFLEYLVINDGVEALEWTFSGDGDEPGAVYVFLAGVEDEKGEYATYCTVYTESRDYQRIAYKVQHIIAGENDDFEKTEEDESAE